MSWTPIVADATAKKTGAPVSICVSAGMARRRRYVTVVFRDPEILALPWMGTDGRVDVLIGASEHAGMLRIVPGVRTRVKRVGGRRFTQNFRALHCADLAAALPLQPGARGPDACDYDFGDTWIEITLPAWARRQDAATPPSVQSEPYRGAFARMGAVTDGAKRTKMPT